MSLVFIDIHLMQLGDKLYRRVAVLDNCLFALGGFDSTNYQSSVERLDPRMGKWMSVPR